MKLREFEADFQLLLAQAGKMLGGEARPLQMSWSVEQALDRRVVRRDSRGIGTERPMMCLYDARRGHVISIGIQLFAIVDDPTLLLAKVTPPRASDMPSFWAVRGGDYRRFYKQLRIWLRAAREQFGEPVMHAECRELLWDNTIGFLRRDSEQLRRFGVAQKRGLLLTGEPGNGKTMACRWLSAHCERLGLSWDTVDWDDYEAARRSNELHELFQPSCPGVVLFDDFDLALRDSGVSDRQRDQSAFLTEMDGMSPKIGVVYLFTSNLEPKELDAALRRPGRIDKIIEFKRPDAELRRRCIQEVWHEEIVAELPMDELVEATEGMSFAEVEELKKLVVLGYLDGGEVLWRSALETIAASRAEPVDRLPIGFATSAADKQAVGTSAQLDE